MAMNRIGLLVAFAFALHASAALVPFRAAAPARQTDGAELLEKSANGISPVPTSLSKSDLAEMELFRRYDYVLPSSICGWHWYTDMAISFACYESTATAACINIGNYRGCCYGATTDCASAFMTSCIPFGSITVSGSTEQCGSLRTCWLVYSFLSRRE
ncbi:hypothetical protein CONLIGDRAFT_503568 [Coniochaeta ligniaria NRRL 30616]|uniref:Hydrophobin n=1 Tax=Coniochaeta ligniaria NRRL 30616 TaxID=1408157 RepID=A0A1J7IE59_9PEZI|nr:hypothetical protein CONLIGDRAFT_503568 [Coniochaeta ligniaria NRRL 30616]